VGPPGGPVWLGYRPITNHTILAYDALLAAGITGTRPELTARDFLQAFAFYVGKIMQIQGVSKRALQL